MNLLRILAICGLGVVGGVLFRDGSFWLGLGVVLSGCYLEIHRTVQLQNIQEQLRSRSFLTGAAMADRDLEEGSEDAPS